MGYLIGAGPLDPAVKRYNGGTSSFTMDNSGTTNGTLLWVDGVAQVPGTDYNVSGTTITTTTAAGAGTNNVTSLQLFNTGLITTPADNTVAIAKIQDDAVTLAKMAAGTDGNLISYDTSGNPVAVATGDDGQVLTSSGAGAVCAFEDASSGGLTLGTEASTGSGTSVTFTGIPAGTKEVRINLMGVSSSSNVDIFVQLGDSGGLETSGYLCTTSNLAGATAASANITTYFRINKFASGDIVHGTMILTLSDTSNTWSQMHVCANSNAATTYFGAGQKPLSGELTQIKFGIELDAFTAGTVNIAYA